MSTDYEIACMTCWRVSGADYVPGHARTGWDNVRYHQIHDLNKLITKAAAIAAIDTELFRDTELHVQFTLSHGDVKLHGLAEFMRAHAGHELAVLDEYGRWDEHCPRCAMCPTCKHEKPCRRRRDHEGECSPVEEVAP